MLRVENKYTDAMSIWVHINNIISIIAIAVSAIALYKIYKTLEVFTIGYQSTFRM